MIENTSEVTEAIRQAYCHPPTRMILEGFAKEWGLSFEAAWLFAEQHQRQQMLALEVADLQMKLAEATGVAGAA